LDDWFDPHPLGNEWQNVGVPEVVTADPPKVVDLMANLEASLAAAKARKES
jgi:hypothetical protein